MTIKIPMKKPRFEAYIDDELTNDLYNDLELGVYRVSVVSDPAIEAHGVFLSKEAMQVFLADNEKQILIAPVLIPDKIIPRVDSNGEAFELVWRKAEIEKNYKVFQKRSGKRININHTNRMLACEVVDSYVVGLDKPNAIYHGFNDSIYPPGTWIMAIHVPNKRDWESIKLNGFDAFSIEANVFFEKIKYNNISVNNANKANEKSQNGVNMEVKVETDKPKSIMQVITSFFTGKTKDELEQDRADIDAALRINAHLESIASGTNANTAATNNSVAIAQNAGDNPGSAKHELNPVEQNGFLKSKLDQYETGNFLQNLFAKFLLNIDLVQKFLECQDKFEAYLQGLAAVEADGLLLPAGANIEIEMTKTQKPNMSKLTELAEKRKAITLAKTSGVILDGDLMGKALVVQDDNTVMIADAAGAAISALPAGTYTVKDIDGSTRTLIVDASAMVVSYEPVVADAAPPAADAASAAIAALTDMVKLLSEKMIAIEKMMGVPTANPINQTATIIADKSEQTPKLVIPEKKTRKV